jgi:hypothetical protein
MRIFLGLLLIRGLMRNMWNCLKEAELRKKLIEQEVEKKLINLIKNYHREENKKTIVFIISV